MKGFGYRCDHCGNHTLNEIVDHLPYGWIAIYRKPIADGPAEEHEFCCWRCAWEFVTVKSGAST